MSKKGHHGGAWKVAYADFVTAMMALFMVLWLAAQDQKIKEAIERAFRHPFMSLTKDGSGLIPAKNKESFRSSTMDITSSSAPEVGLLRGIQNDLNKSLQQMEIQETVRINLTPDGLRITVFDNGRKPIFESNSAKLTEYGTWILSTLAWEISRYDSFSVELEGHTEQGYKSIRESYSGWELSADRANSGRRKLEEHGVQAKQIQKVAGYADTKPLPDVSPDDPLNRRITLLLRISPANPTT